MHARADVFLLGRNDLTLGVCVCESYLPQVSHAFEALAGQPLTPALKEPLRPVYVRYHKIKALLGAAAGGSGGKAGAVKAAAGGLVLSTPPAAVVL